MKQLYVILIAFVIGFTMTNQSFAQDATSKQKEQVEKVLSEYQSELNITAGQQNQIRPIMLKQLVLIGDLSKTPPTDAKWVETNKQIRQLHDQIEGLLTDDQKKTKKVWDNKKIVNKKSGKTLNDVAVTPASTDSVVVTPASTDSIQ